MKGDKESIKNLLEIFDGLLEYLTEHIGETSHEKSKFKNRNLIWFVFYILSLSTFFLFACFSSQGLESLMHILGKFNHKSQFLLFSVVEKNYARLSPCLLSTWIFLINYFKANL